MGELPPRGRISGPSQSAVTFREDLPAELCVDGQLGRHQLAMELLFVSMLTLDSADILIQNVFRIP